MTASMVDQKSVTPCHKKFEVNKASKTTDAAAQATHEDDVGSSEGGSETLFVDKVTLDHLDADSSESLRAGL